MTKIFVLLTLLFTVNVFAALECSLDKTPEKGETYAGDVAAVKLQNLLSNFGVIVTTNKDQFGDEIMTYSLVLNSVIKKDPGFPEVGCVRQAQLIDICQRDTVTQNIKCGEICKHSYHCIDNR